LHYLSTKRKSFTILEFGVGWSTIILADALRLNEEKWNSQIMTFRKQKDKHFKEEIVELEYNSQIAKRVTIDLRNKVSIATGGFNSQVAEDSEPYFENFLKQFINFIDLDALVLEANRYKLIWQL